LYNAIAEWYVDGYSWKIHGPGECTSIMIQGVGHLVCVTNEHKMGFQRRGYWLEQQPHIVLVQYLAEANLELETMALSAKVNGKLGAMLKTLHKAEYELNACWKENFASARAVGELKEHLARSKEEVAKLKSDLARKDDEARSAAKAHEASLKEVKLRLAEKHKELARVREELGAREQQLAKFREDFLEAARSMVCAITSWNAHAAPGAMHART